MFIFFFWIAIVCKYWELLACKKSLQLTFLKPHPNSLAVWSSLNSHESEIHVKLPLCLFFWLTFCCRYPCKLLTYFINRGSSFPALSCCFSLHHFVEISVQNVIWSKLLVSISQMRTWGQKTLSFCLVFMGCFDLESVYESAEAQWFKGSIVHCP